MSDLDLLRVFKRPEVRLVEAQEVASWLAIERDAARERLAEAARGGYVAGPMYEFMGGNDRMELGYGLLSKGLDVLARDHA